MELLWCKYKQAEEERLFLYLGDYGTKICCLDNNIMNDASKGIIREAANELDELSLEHKVNWIKENCPSAMKAYRTLNKLDVQVVNKIQVKPSAVEEEVKPPDAEESEPTPPSSDA